MTSALREAAFWAALAAIVPGSSGAEEGSARDRPGAKPGGGDAPKLILETHGFTTAITSLDFSADGRLLVAAGADKAVRIWDLADGHLRATLRGQDGVAVLGMPQAVAFSPSGRELVSGVRCVGPPGAIRVYETSDLGRIAAVLPAHPQGGVADLAFSPDGAYLASAGQDGRITIWDWASRRPLHQLTYQLPLRYLGIPFKLPVLITMDGGGLHLFSAINAKPLQQLTPADIQELGRSLGGPEAIQAFAADLTAKIQAFGQIKSPYSGEDTKMRLYLDTGHAITAGLGKKDGRDTYYVILWSVGQQGRRSLIYDGHKYIPTALALSPDRTLVASGDYLGQVHVWEARTGTLRFRFTGAGRPVYRVGFDASGRKLAFGTRPHVGDRWRENDYADPEAAFDLENRRILDEVPGDLRFEATRQGVRDVKVVNEKNLRSFVCSNQGRFESRYTPQGTPATWTFLRSEKPGFSDPVAFGLVEGQLVCMDPRNAMARREFFGHQGGVMALSESPDGRLLASASTDRTVRLWSLEDFQDQGFPDLDVLSDGTVRGLVPNGSALRAGVQAGDKLLAVDGHDLTEALDLVIQRRWPYRSGQRVPLDLSRRGRPYRVEVELIPGSDYVEPLLSFFAADGEWVAWTPRGYYDASLGGDRLIGWHINQGPAQSAKFYLAQQFHKQFYRPDVIDQLLKTGDPARAIAAANAERSQSGVAVADEGLDLRKPGDLKKLEPPRVRILEPANGARTRNARVRVRARAESQNDLPIREVTILVNGRPAADKAGERAPGAAEGREAVVEREVELLPGQKNQIAVVASNSASASRPVTVTVTDEAAAGAPRDRPKLYLLAIGISEYAHPELVLRYPHKDAADFADAWKRQEGVVYDKVETRVLTNKDATARAILDGMEWLVKNATSKDVTMLFVSSHGFRDSRRNYYMATYDVDPDALRSTAVRWNEVKSLIQDVPGKFVLFVDTCHSGGVTGAKGAVADDPLRELVSEDAGTIVFSSSMAREVSLEDPRWGHGAFTRAILDTVENPAEADYNHDGYLSLAELNNNLAERVKALTKGKQHTATEWPPTISDFNFYRFATPAPAPALAP